jgi:hypothetical protein
VDCELELDIDGFLMGYGHLNCVLENNDLIYQLLKISGVMIARFLDL